MSKLKNKGFTLLEVMLAVTILSVGLVLVLRTFLTTLWAIKVSRNFLVASLLLEEKIWQKQEENMRLQGIIAEDEQAEFDPPLEEFRYEINFQEQEGLPSLYQSTFAVSWQQKERGHSISCITYLRSKEE